MWTESLQDTAASCSIPPACSDKASCSFIIVGDNIDKNVSPRDMQVNSQVQSVHYFNYFAVHDRINTSFSPDCPTIDPMSIPTSAFLPTAEDCSGLRRYYITLVARVVTKNMKYFKHLQQCVPIITCTHVHSDELHKKSETVSYCNAWLQTDACD